MSGSRHEEAAAPRVGVLALQGDFREHLAVLTSLGAVAVPVRRHVRALPGQTEGHGAPDAGIGARDEGASAQEGKGAGHRSEPRLLASFSATSSEAISAASKWAMIFCSATSGSPAAIAA